MSKAKTPKGKAPKARPRPKPGTSAAAAQARRKRFVEEYVGNGGNGTMAAKAVGYSEKTAHSAAHRLLKDAEIVAAIKRRRAELQKKYELSAEDTVQKLAQMVHFDVSTLYDETNRLKPVHLWPPEAASCVQGIEAGPLGVMKVKTIGRLDAVVAAMKHFGQFEKDNRQRVSDPIRELMDHIAKHNEGIVVKP